MRSLIKKILKEEQEWFDDIKPMNVYLRWVEDGIKGLEEWGVRHINQMMRLVRQ